MRDWNEIGADLDKKLDPKHVRPPKQFGPKGDYLEGWFCMAEANRIFGFDGWSYEITECTCVYQAPREIGQQKKPGFGVTYTAKVRVNVLGVVREDFGAGHGYDVDCGLAHESAIKEAVTDSLKRALRSFGNPFGLALYDKTRENVGVDAPPPQIATEAETIDAIDQINAAGTLPDLGKVWTALNTTKHIAAHPFVIAAKDARKAALTQQKAA